MYRRILSAGVLLLLLFPPAAAAGGPAMLGARLDTAGTWVAVISKATIPAHVELSAEGDVQLAVAAFDIEPGERRQVAYTGSGVGWVSARMTPLDVPAGASSGALEVRAWVRYVEPPPPASDNPLLFLLFGIAPVLGIVAWRFRRHAR